MLRNLHSLQDHQRLQRETFVIKVASVTDENGNSVDLSELKAKGYTVKYKFYRFGKESS